VARRRYLAQPGTTATLDPARDALPGANGVPGRASAGGASRHFPRRMPAPATAWIRLSIPPCPGPPPDSSPDDLRAGQSAFPGPHPSGMHADSGGGVQFQKNWSTAHAETSAPRPRGASWRMLVQGAGRDRPKVLLSPRTAALDAPLSTLARWGAGRGACAGTPPR